MKWKERNRIMENEKDNEEENEKENEKVNERKDERVSDCGLKKLVCSIIKACS